MTPSELEALAIAASGTCSTGARSEVDDAAGIRCLSGRIASRLIADGFLRRVPAWGAVEITDAGRAALADGGGRRGV